MLLLKLIGSLLIFSVGGSAAFFLNRLDSERLSRLDAIIDLMKFIRREIDYFCLPIQEIFRRVDPKIIVACGSDGKVSDFDSFIKSLSPTPDSEIMSVLIPFSRELGSSYREEQLKNCDIHINSLISIRDSAVNELKKSKKLHTTLCLSAAAAVVILII